MNPVPVTFSSHALRRRLNFYLYLPPGYEESGKRYPVVYLLHGRYDSETAWPFKGSAYGTLERMIRSGELTECIAVMPSDGGYDRGTYYMDWYDGSGNFEQYLIHDLIPYVDAAYRTLAEPASRAVAGLSMGGYGAIMLALRNPNLFGAAASLSGALGMMPLPGHYRLTPDWDPMELARLAGPANGPHSLAHNLSWLANRAMAGGRQPALYINCGTEDFLYESNIWFKNELAKIHYPYLYQEFSGVHNWEYWTEHLPDVLAFLQSNWGKIDISEE